MGRCGTRECRRRGGEVEGVDPKSVDVGDECYRLTLTNSFSKYLISFVFIPYNLCFFLFQGIYSVWFIKRSIPLLDKLNGPSIID